MISGTAGRKSAFCCLINVKNTMPATTLVAIRSAFNLLFSYMPDIKPRPELVASTEP